MRDVENLFHPTPPAPVSHSYPEFVSSNSSTGKSFFGTIFFTKVNVTLTFLSHFLPIA